MRHPLLAHVWTAHLDVPPTAKLSPLPVGLNPQEFKNLDVNVMWERQHHPPSDLRERPLRMLVCDRLHQDRTTYFKTRWEVRRVSLPVCAVHYMRARVGQGHA
jgi:hypothetical protein